MLLLLNPFDSPVKIIVPEAPLSALTITRHIPLKAFFEGDWNDS
jgi:hypothetical protein